MSVKAMAWAWDQDCSPTAKLVLLAIADHSDSEGKSFPSHGKLAEKTGISRRSIVAIVHQLESLGMIEIELRHRSDGGKASSIYRLKMHPPCEATSHTPCEATSHPHVKLTHPPCEATSHPLKGREPSINRQYEPKDIRAGARVSVGEDAREPIKTLLASFGIGGEIADDYITHMKEKRVAITRTFLNSLKREADKAGLPMSQVATVCIERGWKGFEADWLNVTKQGNVINAKSKFINSGFDNIDYGESGLI